MKRLVKIYYYKVIFLHDLISALGLDFLMVCFVLFCFYCLPASTFILITFLVFALVWVFFNAIGSLLEITDLLCLAVICSSS